jgi:16S rRNA (cytosine1402-N4)-methyltransferase
MNHTPVLLNEMLEALAPHPGGIYIDATFGGGSYTRAILQTGARVIAFDRDPFVQKFADGVQLIQAPFSQMADHVQEKVDGVVFDFGVSSFQIDTPNRGFSFQHEGPLDMRMGEGKITAALVVNTYVEKDLADIIYTYGEEHSSRFIAKLIVANRPFHTTKKLADLLAKHLKGKPHLHPATLTFQALRIYVNDELHEIQNGLTAALSLLKPVGRLVTISFHALEDRIVKQFFKMHSFEPLYKHVITPSKQEIKNNPRARSARLRAGIKPQEEKERT